MKLFFHIGMGKTGTSSIQSALTSSREVLAEKGVHYMGMWFDQIDPKYDRILGMRDLLHSDPDVLRDGAARFVEHMDEIKLMQGSDTFVFSNEDLYGHVARIEPFISTLAKQVEVKLVLYVRPFQSWLPSAYVQWAIRHKTTKGPIPPFRDAAERWINTFRALDKWQSDFGQYLTVRQFDKSVDVVEDFASVIGTEIPNSGERILERAEDAEVLLRALYNTRFAPEVFPDRFNSFVMNPTNIQVPRLEEAVEDYLNFDSVAQVIEPYVEEFTALEQRLGVEIIAKEYTSKMKPDVEALKARMFDYVIEMGLSQSVQIQRLTKRLRMLEEKVEKL